MGEYGQMNENMVVLSKGTKRNRYDSVFDGKRVMCFVGSPFQFFALLCIFSSEANCSYQSLDLYVYPSFREVYEVCSRFCEIVRVRHCFYNENFNNPPKIPKLAVIKCLEAMTYSNLGKSRFVEAFPQVKEGHYDIVMCSSASDHTITAKQVYAPNGFTIFYDDGIGSHNGNVFKSNFCLDAVLPEERQYYSEVEWRRNKLKAVARLVGRSGVQHNIRAIFLFNPGLFESKLYPTTDIERIMIPDDVSIVRQCISPKSNGDAYKDVRFVFLSLSGDAPEKWLAIEESLIRLFANSLEGFVVRPHPRRNLDDFKSMGVRVVDNSDFWEILLLQGSIGESTTLIGFGSSAQIHPKTFFDLEPRVVFLHRVLSGEGHASTSADLLVENIKRRYEEEKKVLVFDSIEQCADSIESLLS